MKNFRSFIIVIIAMCFLVSLVSIGWAADKIQIPPGAVTPQTGIAQQIFPHCPSGFVMNASGSSCDRTKPANPCAMGFHVEWGTCVTGTGLGAGDPYPCGYKCIPDMPTAGSFTLKCPAGYYPDNPFVGACQISCRQVIK
jgi:hypothetical protein